MFRAGTTFVIGAGASAEFGLPVGTGLAKKIKASAVLQNTNRPDAVVGDDAFLDNLLRLWPQYVDRMPAFKAAKTIENAVHTAVSIDAFIDRFAGDKDIELIGKMLIALEIGKAERASSMWPETWRTLDQTIYTGAIPQGHIVTPDDTWIGHFFRILCDGVQDPRELGKEISIICFNYDRCIEYYLRRQISAAYRIKLSEAHEIVMGMDIIHPYGTLGELTLETAGQEDGKLSFGAHMDEYIRLDEIAKNIRTYTEQQHKSEIVNSTHEAIARCNVLVFLGFGFNNQNLDLLRVSPIQGYENLQMPVIYASGHGIESQVEDTIKRRILHLLFEEADHTRGNRDRVTIEYGKTCEQLFRIHNMNLSSFKRRYFVPVEDRVQRVIVAASVSD